MAIHDISLPISRNLVTWPGDPKIELEKVYQLEKGDAATVSRISMGVHSGTHIDAPGHFIAGGNSVDKLDLEILTGSALVVDVLEADSINAVVLEKLTIPEGTRRLLLRTRNSELWAHDQQKFTEDFVSISEEGARWITEHGIKLVGIDYLSVAPFGESGPVVHKILLQKGTVIVEGLNLSNVETGSYQLICLPLKIVGAEGAPARAILIDEMKG